VQQNSLFYKNLNYRSNLAAAHRYDIDNIPTLSENIYPVITMYASFIKRTKGEPMTTFSFPVSGKVQINYIFSDLLIMHEIIKK
jgi:hypothetical protein